MAKKETVSVRGAKPRKKGKAKKHKNKHESKKEYNSQGR